MEVAKRRLDTMISESRGTLLFKLDVEGHEPDCLAGMAELFTHADTWCGLVEITPGAGTVEALVSAGATIYVIRSSDGEFERATTEQLARVDSEAGLAEFAKDVVAISSPVGLESPLA